ncbi:hypothetical protein GCM10023310_70550 [Paenibacillus vulneris]|uniref:Uncharacterized protein n=1 Tax=Paenibacillus vulneris TaxID=1133364 RepID=A0ABW3UFN7_9BACL
MIIEPDLFKEVSEELQSLKWSIQCEMFWENVKTCGFKLIHRKTRKQVTNLIVFEQWHDKVSIFLDHSNSSRRQVKVENIKKYYELIK